LTQIQKQKNMKFLNLVIAILFFSSFGACSKSSTDITDTSTTGTSTSFTNIAYASTSSAQKMDIYLPTGGAAKNPVVVYIHGGAFMLGDKASSMDLSVINKIVAKGYAVASINYRFSSEANYPAQIKDCKAAVRFLRANAAKYSIDPEKIASWGGSAGGCLSSLLGTTSGVAELEGEELGNASYSSKVLASVDWYGPIEFLTMDAQASAQGFTINTNSSSSPESKLIGAAVQTVPDKTNKANALKFITTDDAAFYIQNGTADVNIPMAQSKNLYDALVPVIGSANVVHEVLSGAGHGGSQLETDENLTKIVTFLNKYLK
jgi:acetyl esterase/lipase